MVIAMSNKDLIQLERDSWWISLNMVMSSVPEAYTTQMEMDLVDSLLTLDEDLLDKVPDEFTVAEDYEEYPLSSLQELIEEFKDVLFQMAKKAYRLGERSNE